MAIFEWTLALLLGAVLLAGVARRIGVPYPALLALAGAGLAFLPFAPTLAIDPDLALALFVAPILLDAGFDTSPAELRRYAWPIGSLVLVAVVLTTAAVAGIGYGLAGLPLAAAIALGAIVAPPDAAAVSAVLGQVRLPRPLVTILQGESLLNDATSLFIYRLAVGAAVGAMSASAVPVQILLAIASVPAGVALAWICLKLTRRIGDAASGTILQFVTTFGVWLIAERVGLSAIVTMVAYAMTLGRSAPAVTAARSRISSYSVWETAIFVLNVLAFVLMGLQARPILERLTGAERTEAFLLAGAVLVAIVAVRIAWVGAFGFVRRLAAPAGLRRGSWRSDLLIGWCGVRGLVTLATAFALPETFPARDAIVLTAFCVVLGTLVVQGLTILPLIRLLGFEPDTSAAEETSRARVAVVRAALDCLDGDSSPAAAALRGQYEAALEIAGDVLAPQAATSIDELRLAIIARQRTVLHAMRAAGEISDETYHRLEEEIDWAELDAAPAGHFQPLTT